ncbi:putative DNA repair helicase rad5,16 [Planoprotostelium fungivorum]|uniref:Putative DNA repair helicase rad5,16 n=1 Tax=Planoprotostelium fungivorum TaxID=1890364 RepID=A0A2P6NHY8_9EUKA|nr:putative DNA repair helicase rad5,16 [Planoprotostelium fungivorum]
MRFSALGNEEDHPESQNYLGRGKDHTSLRITAGRRSYPVHMPLGTILRLKSKEAGGTDILIPLDGEKRSFSLGRNPKCSILEPACSRQQVEITWDDDHQKVKATLTGRKPSFYIRNGKRSPIEKHSPTILEESDIIELISGRLQYTVHFEDQSAGDHMFKKPKSLSRPEIFEATQSDTLMEDELVIKRSIELARSTSGGGNTGLTQDVDNTSVSEPHDDGTSHPNKRLRRSEQDVEDESNHAPMDTVQEEKEKESKETEERELPPKDADEPLMIVQDEQDKEGEETQKGRAEEKGEDNIREEKGEDNIREEKGEDNIREEKNDGSARVSVVEDDEVIDDLDPLELAGEGSQLARYEMEQEMTDEEYARQLQNQFDAELEVIEKGEQCDSQEREKNSNRVISIDENNSLISDEEFARQLQEEEDKEERERKKKQELHDMQLARELLRAEMEAERQAAVVVLDPSVQGQAVQQPQSQQPQLQQPQLQQPHVQKTPTPQPVQSTTNSTNSANEQLPKEAARAYNELLMFNGIEKVEVYRLIRAGAPLNLRQQYLRRLIETVLEHRDILERAFSRESVDANLLIDQIPEVNVKPAASQAAPPAAPIATPHSVPAAPFSAPVSNGPLVSNTMPVLNTAKLYNIIAREVYPTMDRQTQTLLRTLLINYHKKSNWKITTQVFMEQTRFLLGDQLMNETINRANMEAQKDRTMNTSQPAANPLSTPQARPIVSPIVTRNPVSAQHPIPYYAPTVIRLIHFSWSAMPKPANKSEVAYQAKVRAVLHTLAAIEHELWFTRVYNMDPTLHSAFQLRANTYKSPFMTPYLKGCTPSQYVTFTQRLAALEEPTKTLYFEIKNSPIWVKPSVSLASPSHGLSTTSRPVVGTPLVKMPGVGIDGAHGNAVGASGNVSGAAGGSTDIGEKDLQKIMENQVDELPEKEADKSLRVSLYTHQKQALWWMCQKEEKDHCGILADDMGLGKTVEAMALMVTNRIEGPQLNLIVCPVSLVYHWDSEIKNKTKGVLKKVLVYHGASRIRDVKRLSEYDVIITTYNTIASEWKSDGVGPLLKVKFHRVLLDEAHAIKNKATRSAKACFELKAKNRWCLTGTPIHNTLDDLYSLIVFMKYKPYNDLAVWKNKIVAGISKNNANNNFAKVRALMKVLLLRRMKNSTIDGRPIITLPPKEETLRKDDFTPEEADFYRALETQAQVQFNKYLRAGSVMRNYSNVLVLLLRLRQACDHPTLVISRSDVESGEKPLMRVPDMPKGNDVAGRISKEAMERIQLNADECSVCLEVRTEPTATICGHIFCRECIYNTINLSPLCPMCRHTLGFNDLISLDKLVPTDEEKPKDIEFEAGKSQQYDSTKMRILISGLFDMQRNNREDKAVVFSQWTSMLDLIGPKLDDAGFKYLRFDGTLSMSQRQRVLDQFSADPTAKVLLMSLKTGGVGLNLCTANHLFFLDCWWNPQIERQAVDRVYRLGQTKNVKIVRLSISETVEERILKMQEAKLALAENTLGGGSQQDRKLSIEDLKFLFGVR